MIDRRAPRRLTLRWACVVVLAMLLPRLWRFEAVGEGVDESYSVKGTRALLAGRFSYTNLNDFCGDAYQAKLTPVAELSAVPFVAALGDRAAAFRTPSLLASLALGVLIAAFALRRWGPSAAIAATAFAALDYRGVTYAQTHRYVAIEQLLAFGLFLAALAARRRGGVLRSVLVVLLGVALVHAHLLALLWIGPLVAVAAFDAWRGRRKPLRPPLHVGALVVVALHGVVMLAIFKSLSLDRFFPDDGLASGLARSGSITLRTIEGLGPPAAVLGLPAAVAFLRARGTAERWLAASVLGPLAAFALGAVRLGLAPRYLLVAQPFAILAAAAAAGRLADRIGAVHPIRRVLVLATAALPGAALVAWYLATGGPRDAEVPIYAEIERRATLGDAVLWDLPTEDPYHRRPRGYPSVPTSNDLWDGPAPLDRLRRLEVCWIVRSTGSTERPQLFTPDVVARMQPVASTTAPALFRTGETLTLYRYYRYPFPR